VSEEIWKDIPGFEGFYEISSFGRIKSFKKNRDGEILKLTNKKGHYFSFVLQGKGKERKSARIHRLVAEAFIPNPDNLPEVNHKDGNKQNNMVDNLEWCTSSHNVQHSIRMHREQLNPMIYYNQHIKPKPIIQLQKDGSFVNRFENSAEAEKATGVCQRNILQVANRTPFKPGHPRKSAGGFVWRFESEVMQK